jgi:hypothetical protein
MSTDFRSCPNCKAMVLSDTYECPDCAYVFDEIKSSRLGAFAERPEPKVASLEQECQGCGAMVRVGLVRCWNCNAFMREDVARRYQQISATPQKIIFSDIPEHQRTDFLPTRLAERAAAQFRSGKGSDPGVASTAVIAQTSDSSFEVVQRQKTQRAIEEEHQQSADKPESKTPTTIPGAKEKTPGAKSESAVTAPVAPGPGNASANGGTAAPPAADADDLLSIAIAELREGMLRGKGPDQTRVIIPCPECQALLPVTQKHAGRKIRCRACSKVIQVPAFNVKTATARKRRPAKKVKETRPSILVTWMNDAWLHVFSPTSLVLKPGSLAANHTLVDVAITDSGVFLVSYVKETGKSRKPVATDKADGGMLSFVRSKLFGIMSRGKGNASEAATDLRERWKKVREHVERTGEFKDLPNAEVQPVGKDIVGQLKLVQPIAKVSESMFAGVPVFGEGRMALFLPVTGADDKQTYLSMPISKFRTFAETLKNELAIELPVAENGIPLKDKVDGAICFFNQTRFESLAQPLYYQVDSDYQLEVSGYRCTACGITVGEEGRKKNKLGGANGKSIAKAKCPKCGAKFGNEPLYKIVKAPEVQAEASEAAAAE